MFKNHINKVVKSTTFTSIGTFQGKCNRKACSENFATWYNHATKRYYCAKCAHDINRHNRSDAMALFGHDLCTQGKQQ